MEASKYPTYKPRELDAQAFQDLHRSGEAHSVIGPNNVLLQVNYACHLHCQMCDRHMWSDLGAPAHKAFSTEELRNLFDQLSGLGTGRITLVGTEPVMRPDLPEILAAIRQRGIKPELYTAGIKLTDTVIQAVLDTESDVAFSVDGFKPESHNKIRVPDHNFDAFNRTVASIHRLSGARDVRGLTPDDTRISANFTIQKDNILDLATVTQDEIDRIGVDVLRMSLVHGKGGYMLTHPTIKILRKFAQNIPQLQTKTEVDLSSGVKYAAQGRINNSDFDDNVLVASDFLQEGYKPQCHIGEYSTMIDPQGNVRPCLYLYDDNGPYNQSNRDAFIMGNVKQQPFVEIWNGDKYSKFRSGGYPDIDADSRCRTCEYMEDFEEIDKVIKDPKGKVRIGW